jgi:Cof subfamily protein (haloacid dehalogenase superfamily)
VICRLLALDVDGTVAGKSRRVSPAVRAAVAAAQARGVYVTLATGREFRSAHRFARDLGLSAPLICSQGAVIRDCVTLDVLHHVPMSGTLAAEAITMLHEADVCVIASIDDKLHIVTDGPAFAGFARYWGAPDPADVVVAPNLAEITRRTPPTKVMFFGDPSIVDRELARISDHFGEALAFVRSDVSVGEMIAPGLSKGIALAAVADRLGVERDQVIAIGDEENDVPMLQWAGLGLAMGNAPDAVKRMADAVIPSVDDDGVAWAIDRYILSIALDR